MASVKYMETNSTDPAYNLAFEECLLTSRQEGEHLILWQNANAVIVGRNQNTAAEINREFIQEQGIKVIRRITGGGAVYHDLGNINYSFITDVEEQEKMTIEAFTMPVVNALRNLGLQAEASGRNDILVSSKKVSGTAQRIVNGRILHHGTLLFDSDLEVIQRALNPSKEKFIHKSAKSVKSRVTNIRPLLKEDMGIKDFWDYLVRELGAAKMEKVDLTDAEKESVMRLRDSKYNTWEWNFGKSPEYTYTNRARWPGGGIEVFVNVKNGMIEEVSFYGDFLGLLPCDPVQERLVGCRYNEKDVKNILDGMDIHMYFGGITSCEIIETMFA